MKFFNFAQGSVDRRMFIAMPPSVSFLRGFPRRDYSATREILRFDALRHRFDERLEHALQSRGSGCRSCAGRGESSPSISMRAILRLAPKSGADACPRVVHARARPMMRSASLNAWSACGNESGWYGQDTRPAVVSKGMPALHEAAFGPPAPETPLPLTTSGCFAFDNASISSSMRAC